MEYLAPYIDMFPDQVEQLRAFFARATATWVVYQVLAILFAVICSFTFTRAVSRRIEAFLDGEDGHWLRTYKRDILERIAPLIFLVVVWLFWTTFRQITWTSNTLLLGSVAKLATAWIVINILASVIRNRFVFRIVSISLWIIAALSILRLMPAVTVYLDTIAISLGDTRLSALRLIKAVILLGLLLWAVGFAAHLLDTALRRSTELSPSMKVLIGKLVRIVFFFIAVMIALRAVGLDLTTFAVFSGAIGVGIGFGLQKSVSNFVSGISLLLDKSIKPGDVISLGDTFGWINQLNTRYTSVVTRDGREHLIPNEQLISQEVVNWSYSDQNVRIEVPFGVSYDADPHQVKSLIEAGLVKHRRILAKPAPIVHFSAMGESSLDFIFRFWIRDPAEGVANIKSDVLFAIWDILKENNIEIPFPQRVVHLRHE